MISWTTKPVPSTVDGPESGPMKRAKHSNFLVHSQLDLGESWDHVTAHKGMRYIRGSFLTVRYGRVIVTVGAENEAGDQHSRNYSTLQRMASPGDDIGMPAERGCWLCGAAVRRVLALVLFALAVWAVAYSLSPSDVRPPDGQLFELAVLSIAAYIAGHLISFAKLPPLLGMLAMGIILRNVGFVEFTGQYDMLQGKLRNIALVIILTRAGLGLDPSALRRLSLVIARLAVVPSIVEICVSAVISHFLFHLPWVWSFLLGSVLAAVSPAVVIPCLFSLQRQGYGLDKGIPTLIIAAASFDDIIGISIFRIILSVMFSSGNLTEKILEGPLAVIFGVSFGLAWGFTIGLIPQHQDTRVNSLRTLLVGVGGLLAMFGSIAIKYEGAGPLGCVVAAFTSRQVWRSKGWVENDTPVGSNFEVLWTIFQPILFGLIGSAVDLKLLDPRSVGLGIACLSVAVTVRLAVSVLIASGAGLNWKEKLFVAMAWFPKATVQAAIGPIAYDMAKTLPEKQYANIVLIVAVLSIVITAPIGAISITLIGPRLLTKEEEPVCDCERPTVLVYDGEEQPFVTYDSCSVNSYSTFQNQS
ncbi:sodium/hydrogen exchanger 9B2-like [Periplaneta americana]|uniref:sodium/hydrogen exchanger 9B2-like n=1 Tax=Periplaneta americana TaxID=6978 RepID=UPI0037E71BE4